MKSTHTDDEQQGGCFSWGSLVADIETISGISAQLMFKILVRNFGKTLILSSIGQICPSCLLTNIMYITVLICSTQNELTYNRHCFEAPVAATSPGSTHRCDDLLPFALPLSACLSILPIKPTDNSLARPLNTQAALGKGSIMDTSPQEAQPWPYSGTSQTTTINKQMFIFVSCFAL